MNRLKRFFGFIGISGLGWCLDFAIYTVLTAVCGLSVVYANYISTIPAITLVFFLSTRHTFRVNPGGLPLWAKYVLYILYQLVLVSAVSWLGQVLYELLAPLPMLRLLLPYLKPGIKLGITPITMLANYLVLGRLVETL